MYYVVLDGVFKLYSCSRGPLGELTEATAKELTSRKRVVLTDLSTYGTHLLGVLAGWGHSPKVFGVNMEIMRMEVGGCTFKNARLFGIKLSHDWAAVGRCVLELELFMYKCGGLKVSDRGVCSLVSASTALIKGLGGGVRIPYGSELDSELGRWYFGGRRQVFSDANGSSYDFPSMYPTMQLRPLPGGYRAESAAADFSEPGFYSVDFEYDGDCKAPRLPVRSEGGGVVYSRRGCGTFWNEELLAFTKCGGSVSLVGKALLAEDCGTYLRDVQLRLLDDRRGGGQFAKAVANGVYGRLALRPDNPTVGWRRIHNKDLNSLLAYRKYETDGGVVLYEERTPPRARALWRNVGWAGIITARARAELMLLCLEAELAGYDIVSLRTDCVSINTTNTVIIGGKTFGP